MSAACCTLCAFYHGAVTNPDASPPINHGTGECRRHTPKCATDEDGSGRGMGIWPVVDRLDWCGEFKSAARWEHD